MIDTVLTPAACVALMC